MLPKFLRYDYPLHESFMCVAKYSLGSIGSYPESKPTIGRKIWALFNLLTLAINMICAFLYGLHYIRIDAMSAMDALCPMCACFSSLHKIFCIWWHRDEFAGLIQRIWQLTEAGHQTDEKLQLKYFYFSLAMRQTALFLGLAILTGMSYSLRPIIDILMQYWHGEEIVFSTPFTVLYPEILLTLPYYPFTYIYNVWYSMVIPAGICGAAGLYVGFCMNFSLLLKLLQLDIRDTLRELTEKEKKLSTEQTIHKLKELINRHSEIAELIERFSAVVGAFTLAHFVSSSVVIGTSVVDLLIFSGFGVVVYVVYTCAVTTELFLYCFGGTAVVESSFEVGEVTYCSHWCSYDVKVQKMVLLLLLRSQREFRIKVPFFSPTLPAFASILRFTGSLIALATQFL